MGGVSGLTPPNGGRPAPTPIRLTRRLPRLTHFGADSGLCSKARLPQRTGAHLVISRRAVRRGSTQASPRMLKTMKRGSVWSISRRSARCFDLAAEPRHPVGWVEGVIHCCVTTCRRVRAHVAFALTTRLAFRHQTRGSGSEKRYNDRPRDGLILRRADPAPGRPRTLLICVGRLIGRSGRPCHCPRGLWSSPPAISSQMRAIIAADRRRTRLRLRRLRFSSASPVALASSKRPLASTSPRRIEGPGSRARAARTRECKLRAGVIMLRNGFAAYTEPCPRSRCVIAAPRPREPRHGGVPRAKTSAWWPHRGTVEPPNASRSAKPLSRCLRPGVRGRSVSRAACSVVR